MEEKPTCQHKWIPLLGRVGKKNVPTSLFTCLKCGDLKVGRHSIKISQYRLDMDNKPIRIGTTAGIVNDHTVSGLTFTFTAGIALAFGQVCYMGSDGKMELVNADAIATANGFMMCASVSIAENATGNFLLIGYARDDTWNWATLGSLLVADKATPGGMLRIVDAPTGEDDVIQILGVAITADIIYFNPQLVQVERAL